MRAFYRRTGDASVPFCNKGGTTAHVTGFSVKKNRNKAKSVPMWVQGRDLNPRPPGYHFVPVAVVCRKPSPVRLCSLALWATPLSKTIHRIVFDSLTQRATLIGLITRYIKRRTDMVRHNVGAGEGFEPPTSGLSLRAGRRRVSQTFACSALFARTLGDTALKNNSPDCF